MGTLVAPGNLSYQRLSRESHKSIMSKAMNSMFRVQRRRGLQRSKINILLSTVDEKQWRDDVTGWS